MATSDLIAEFILSAIERSDTGFAELQRSALAERFSCVPSQINYVISTRFSQPSDVPSISVPSLYSRMLSICFQYPSSENSQPGIPS